MVRNTASQLRETRFSVAEAQLSEQIGKALREELGSSRRATKTVMRWTNVSDTTARGWINGRVAPSGRHLLALAAKEIYQNAAAGKGSGNLLENHARRVLVMQNDLGCHANILLP